MRKRLSSVASRLALAGALLLAAPGAASAQSTATDCPNNSTIRFGVEPYEDAAILAPAYEPLAEALGKALNCKVELNITTNYTSEIEAMRANKLEIAEFGPLAYVFAHKLAGAELVATFSDADGNPATSYASIVTQADSGITDLSGVAGRAFAYSDPASTSGHLYPAFALKSNGIDPDTGVQAIYAGSHTSAYEALRNHKVDAGELNSDRIATATAAGQYSPDDWVTLWQSAPIPQDPITVRGNLSPAFKSKIKETLLAFDFGTLSPEVQQMFKSDVAMAGSNLVPQDDSSFDEIRSLVSTLNVDLSSL